MKRAHLLFLFTGVWLYTAIYGGTGLFGAFCAGFTFAAFVADVMTHYLFRKHGLDEFLD